MAARRTGETTRRVRAVAQRVARALGVALTVLGCGDAPDAVPTDGRRVVVARLGDPGLEAGTRPPTRVRVGPASRPGLCTFVPHTLALRVPETADVLRLAVARKGGEAGDRPRLEIAASDGRVLLVHPIPPAPDASWQPLALPLEGLREAGSLQLRTRREAPPAEGDAPLAVCLGSVRFEAREAPSAPRPPSVLVVLLDTLAARALGRHGGPAGVSPAIDAFLAEGFDFRRATTPYGNTYVAHSSLFSALHPVRHQRYDETAIGPARPPLDSLVADFAAHGYTTVGFTEDTYVGAGFGFDAGFDLYHDGTAPDFAEGSGDSARTFERALHWLATQGRERRFLMFLHTYEVHSPYQPRDAEARAFADALTPGDARRFDPRRLYAAMRAHNAGAAALPPRDLARLRALYRGEVRYLDRRFASLRSGLERLGLDRSTLVVLTSDHGEAFGEDGKVGHGVTLHDRVLHVPLAFAGPGVSGGRTSDAAVGLIDVLPTLLDLAGLPARADVDGRSLAPLLRGESAALAPAAAYAELRLTRPGCAPEGGDACRTLRDAVRTERFKLVQARDGSHERLTDLRDDPGETRDVSAEQPAALARHRALLQAYRALPPTSPPGAAEAAPIDAETLRRLEALGYATPPTAGPPPPE